MSGGGKGGSEATEIKLPKEIEQAAKENLNIANEVAAIGFTPYLGPTVAGFSPQQMNSFQNTNQAAGSFGMNNVDLGGGFAGQGITQDNPGFDLQGAAGRGLTQLGQDLGSRGVMNNAQIGQALTGIQAPNAQAGGFSGYSGSSIFNDLLAQMPAAQRAAIESFTMDPFTGAPPTNPAVPPPEFRFGGENSWWDLPENQPVEDTKKSVTPNKWWEDVLQDGR